MTINIVLTVITCIIVMLAFAICILCCKNRSEKEVNNVQLQSLENIKEDESSDSNVNQADLTYPSTKTEDGVETPKVSSCVLLCTGV